MSETHPTTPTVKQEDNDFTVRLTEWLIMHDAYDEDLDTLHIEAFGAFCEQEAARHREAAEASAREKALEEAAKVAENHGRSGGRVRASHKHVATAIRALSTPSENSNV